MEREQAKEIIKQKVRCTDYLTAAPNHRRKSNGDETGLCCPRCESGTHGTGSTGAVKYYAETNSWTCHACEAGHDVFDAYMLQTGANYNDALLSLAAAAGIEIDGTERAQRDFKSANDKRHKEAAKTAHSAPQSRTAARADYSAYYESCSGRIDDPAAASYLQARGISRKTARLFNIGFDPQADPASAPGAMTNEKRLHPAQRIIVPCSKSCYIARSIEPNTPANFKALNPAGSSVDLFNSAILQKEEDIIFIAEGVFDALSFAEAGEAAISLNSKGNGKLLLEQLQKTPTAAGFIICHDNDEDEKTAADTMKRAEELKEQLQANGYKSIVYNVAGGYHDANDALQADRKAFIKRIAAAKKDLNKDDLTTFLEKVQTEAYKPHKTGLLFFDEILGGGFISQTLNNILAAPAAGKTTLCAQLAETMAANKTPVIYLNLEMSAEQMIAKAISARLRRKGYKMTMTDILQGYTWTEEQREKVTAEIEDYKETNYKYIKYSPAGTGTDVNRILKYLNTAGEKAKADNKPAPVVILDYLHLLTGGNDDLQERIKIAVKGLKDYAMKYDTFVICVVAISKEDMTKGKITLASGRDSSNIAYTADVQISLNYYEVDDGNVTMDNAREMERLQNPLNGERDMILRILKNRFGAQGKSARVPLDIAHNLFDPNNEAVTFEEVKGCGTFDDDNDLLKMDI